MSVVRGFIRRRVRRACEWQVLVRDVLDGRVHRIALGLQRHGDAF